MLEDDVKKILIAYSGGLDTSCMLHWLKKKYNAELYAYCADLSGMTAAEKSKIIRKGLATGAKKVIVEDMREEFMKNYVFPVLKADAVYDGEYFMATAIGRPLISKRLADIAVKYGIKTVAHGCTGKGNDQVRFETGLYSLVKDVELLAPLRFWEFRTREEEVAYAKKNKIPVSAGSKKYSLDENIWGVAIECGRLEDPSLPPPADAWQWTGGKLRKQETKITLSFRKGEPVALNGRAMKPVALVEKLNAVGAAYKIGRADIIESRIVGIKSREIYESPAAKIISAAHFDLERMVLDRETLHYKEKLAKDFSLLVYNGRWFSPLREALSAFVDMTQKNVTGSVSMILRPWAFEIVSRTSPNSIYSKSLATYAKGDKFDRSLAEGFIKLSCMDITRRS
ncbi:MAG: argininosuccinate synthase [Elusimicrobia bacterium HGW-Elusimicrobia-2]|nr:MAG: argininosuccinate synthase [Elusimicrobia bacterium HGW-Elusimicrobia-2]